MKLFDHGQFVEGGLERRAAAGPSGPLLGGIDEIAPPDVAATAQGRQGAGGRLDGDQVRSAQRLLPIAQLQDKFGKQRLMRKWFAALSLPPGVFVESGAGHAGVVAG